MDFMSTTVVSKRPKLGHKIAASTISLTDNMYAFRMQMYKIPPTETISLLEFESLAILRLKVLKAVEAEGLRHTKGSKEYGLALGKAVEAVGLLESANADESEARAARRRDHVSHFILRLAFCRSQAARTWFTAQEADLFRYRFGLLRTTEASAFLAANRLEYRMLRMTEGEALTRDVRDAAGGWAEKLGEDEFCRVPFKEALDLVRARKTFLDGGFAYVLRSDITSIITARYKAHLAKAVTVASKYFGFIQEEERLGPFLKKINAHTYVGDSYSGAKGDGAHVAIKDLPGLSRASFPLCMQSLFTQLKSAHHLKHGGRQQLGLFLKGIGLTLEQSLEFWRSEFGRTMEADKFDKAYSYNIRHNYGKEGRRKDYAPYSCTKIICSNPPGPGDVHGCPYRHWDAALLRQNLAGMGLGADVVGKVLDHKKAGQFDQACSRVFEAAHHIKVGAIAQLISHPNEYFTQSRAFISGEKSSKTIGESQEFAESQSQTQSA